MNELPLFGGASTLVAGCRLRETSGVVIAGGQIRQYNTWLLGGAVPASQDFGDDIGTAREDRPAPYHMG